MSTKEQPGPFDGLERAEPDEPVFTLRGHDVLAPGLVAEWVKLRREAINSADMSDDKRELELIQCREAEEIGWSMIDWRNGAAVTRMYVSGTNVLSCEVVPHYEFSPQDRD